MPTSFAAEVSDGDRRLGARPPCSRCGLGARLRDIKVGRVEVSDCALPRFRHLACLGVDSLVNELIQAH